LFRIVTFVGALTVVINTIGLAKGDIPPNTALILYGLGLPVLGGGIAGWVVVNFTATNLRVDVTPHAPKAGRDRSKDAPTVRLTSLGVGPIPGGAAVGSAWSF
jgi:hypothetical protein